MSKTCVIWSPESEKTYLDIVEDLLKRFPPSIANSFIREVERIEKSLSSYNYLAPQSTKVEFRELVISKQSSLIYRIVDRDLIELVTFIDNRAGHDY